MRYWVLLITLVFGLNGVGFAWDSSGMRKHIKIISDQIEERLEGRKDDVLMFIPFRVGSYDGESNTSKFLTESVHIELANRGYKLVDRGALDTLLEEHKLLHVGLLDERTVAKLGKMLGADLTFCGSVGVGYSYIQFRTWISDLETGLTVGGVTHVFTINRRIRKLIASFSDAPPNPSMKRSHVVVFYRDLNGKMQRKHVVDYERR